jgi:environmental stress-induced protein Ves
MMNAMHQLIPLDHIPPQPWRNGGGQTRELLAWPAASDWRLRISLADIEQDGPFSAFPGITRWFTVVEGSGVVLRFGSREVTLGPGSEPVWFDGAEAPGCSLIGGPTRDLNLMVRDGEGMMRAMRSGEPWDGAFAQRGLFTTVAGVLQFEDAATIRLPARSLFWESEAGGGGLRFEVDAPAAGTAAWWLGYAPRTLTP